MIEIKGEEFNVEACIQFTLLQKILIKLAERDNELQDKINDLEKKLKKFQDSEKIIQNQNEKRFKTIEDNITKLSEGNTQIEKYIPPEPKKEVKKKDDSQTKTEVKKDETKKEEKVEYNEKEEKEEKETEKEKIEKSDDNKKEEKDEKSDDNKKEEKEDNLEKEKLDDNKKEEKEDNLEKVEKSDEKENEENDDNNVESDNENEIVPQKNLIIQSSYNLDYNNENNNKIRSNTSDNNGSQELFSSLNKRIHQCEKKIEELQKTSKEHNTLSNGINKNKDDIKDTNKEIDELKKLINDLELKLKQSNEEINKLKIKTQDLNIYDMFKDNGDGDLDASKALILNLEKKVFAKFDQIDARDKNIEEDLFKCKNDVTNFNNLIDSIRRDIESMKKANKDLLDEFNKHKDESSNNFNDINQKIKDLYSKLLELSKMKKKDNSNNNNIDSGIDEDKIKELINNSLNDFEKKIMDNINKLLDELKLSLNNNNNASMSQDDLKKIKDLIKKVNELENKMNLKVNKDVIDEINERLSKIEEELKKKASKYDLEELKEKINQIDDKTKDFGFALEGINEAIEKFRQEMSLVIRKIEFLTGEYSKLAFNQGGDSKNKNQVFDFSKFVDLIKFNEAIKGLNQNLEHLKYKVEANRRDIDDIFERLKHTPTEDDFTQFQNLLKALLEDLRLSCNKKFAEKIDTQKSFRYLETQIKALTESNKNRNEGETWLLAKKPLNGFLCASCESYIKDLNTKNEYVPWNRYPQRDDKTYRMGHGFSRMLQLVNADLLKKQELMKDQGKNYPSDDERNDKGNRIQSGKNRDFKLPIVSNQRGNSAFNRNHNYQNLQSNQNVQSQQINNNFRINPITIQQNSRNDKGDFDKDDNNDPFKNVDNSENQPKITKIVKLNKGPSTIEIGDVKINNNEYLPSFSEQNQ